MYKERAAALFVSGFLIVSAFAMAPDAGDHLPKNNTNQSAEVVLIELKE